MNSAHEPNLTKLLDVVQSLEGLWDWDLASNKIWFSPLWKSQAGLDNGQITGDPDEWYRMLDDNDRDAVRAAIASHLEGLTPTLDMEYRMQHQDGSVRWMHCKGLATRDNAGRAINLTGTQSDITDRKLAERHILKDAFRDSLTGLPNRSLFLDRVDRVLYHHKRHPSELFAVLSLEVKPVLRGGEPGSWETLEPILALAAQSLAKGLRACDSLGRVGGSEFAILLGKISDPKDCDLVVERLRLAAGHAYLLEDQEVYVSIQAGAALGDASHTDAETVLSAAEATRLGKAASVPVMTTIHHKVEREMDPEVRKKLSDHLKEAIRREDFKVQYLPWISLETGYLYGFEALARWKRVSDEQIVGPADFLNVAREDNLLSTIETQVMSVACRKAQDWNKQFRRSQPLLLSVNICAAHLASPALATAVQKALSLTGFPADHLVLEINEKELKRDIGAAATAMGRVAKLGVRWAVDNFGTDPSFFSMIPRLPISFLKIDREVVAMAAQGSDSAAKAGELAAKARNLRIPVVAEGVEGRPHLDRVREWGCAYAQGFYFARPLDEGGAWGLLSANPQW